MVTVDVVRRLALGLPDATEQDHHRPDVCREFYWGKKLACVAVDLTRADDELIRALLGDAWEHKTQRP